MRRAVAVMSAGHWPIHESVATVTLPWDARHRRRIRLDDDAGSPFLLDLPRPAVLGDGDGLALEGQGYIRVRAAEETVIEIKAPTPSEAARLAWHIGNRHAPLQVLPDGNLRILDDPALFAMLEGLGATITRRRAPFQPEPGAYERHPHRHG